MGEEDVTADLEWENRVLCSDESCIGVIGGDGRCRECGLAFDGELPPGGPAVAPAETAQVDTAAPAGPGPGSTLENTVYASSDDMDPEEDWEQRTLCRDEGCIGVIGRDGRCKECGLSFKS